MVCGKANLLERISQAETSRVEKWRILTATFSRFQSPKPPKLLCFLEFFELLQACKSLNSLYVQLGLIWVSVTCNPKFLGYLSSQRQKDYNTWVFMEPFEKQMKAMDTYTKCCLQPNVPPMGF